MKQKRLFSIILVLSLMITTFISSGTLSRAAGMEGDGTEISPYIIRTVSHLYSIPSNSTSFYKLANDLDFKNAKRSPLPDFCGTLDGNGFSIKNIVIQGTPEESDVGLFATLTGANIKNLSIDFAEISCNTYNAGTLAGNVTDSVIAECFSNGGSVSTQSTGGGLVGSAINTNFYRCYSSTSVHVNEMEAGGLVGSTGGGVHFAECSAENIVTGGTNAGGLVGTIYLDSSFTNCYSTSALTVTEELGSAGVAYGNIDNGEGTFFESYFANSITSPIRLALPLSATNCYIDNTICQIQDLTIRQSRTTQEMYTKINYNTWDFDELWTILEGMDYPRLRFMQSGEADIKLKLVLEKNESINLETLYDVTDGSLSWGSSDSTVVSVEQDGTVRALKAGDATISIGNMEDPSVDYIHILVVDDIEGQRITVRLREGNSCRLTADNNKNLASINWNVLDPNVAAVTSKGKVTAVNKGITLITASDMASGNDIGNVYIKVK